MYKKYFLGSGLEMRLFKFKVSEYSFSGVNGGK